MARARNIIDVLIIGDVRKLVGAFNEADRSMGGLLKSAGKVFLASKVVGEGFEFLQDSLAEADRLGDALIRLEGQLGTELTGKIDAVASSFADLGQSRQDILEMSAEFADLGKSVGLAATDIAEFAPAAAGAAASLALIRDQDAATMMDLIARATGGNAKAAKELGVALLQGVAPAEQFRNIMAQLQPTLDAARAAGTDLEGQQAKLGAQWETLQANVGQLVEGPLTDLLGSINDMIALIPSAIDGYGMLGDAIAGAFREGLAPLARLNDALGEMGRLVRSIPFVGEIFGGGGAGVTERDVQRANDLFNERNLQGRP